MPGRHITNRQVARYMHARQAGRTLYDAVIAKHLAGYRQMAFTSRPRQVGKATTARHLSGSYLNWDDPVYRKLIAGGAAAVATHVGLDHLSDKLPVIALDEIHTYGRWMNWLKGFFDCYADRCRVIVTESSRLDKCRQGGDSLSLHVGIFLRPWFSNVTKSLRKEPKWFLRDWSGIEDPGKVAVLPWAVSPPWICHPIRVAILARYPRQAPRAIPFRTPGRNQR